MFNKAVELIDNKDHFLEILTKVDVKAILQRAFTPCFIIEEENANIAKEGAILMGNMLVM